MSEKPDMIQIGIRTLVGDAVCEVRIIARADADRGEMQVALDSGITSIHRRVEEHYKGHVTPTPWFGEYDPRSQ